MLIQVWRYSDQKEVSQGSKNELAHISFMWRIHTLSLSPPPRDLPRNSTSRLLCLRPHRSIRSKAHVIFEAISVSTRRSTEQAPSFSMLQSHLSNPPANFWLLGSKSGNDYRLDKNCWSCTAVLCSRLSSANSVRVPEIRTSREMSLDQKMYQAIRKLMY